MSFFCRHELIVLKYAKLGKSVKFLKTGSKTIACHKKCFQKCQNLKDWLLCICYGSLKKIFFPLRIVRGVGMNLNTMILQYECIFKQKSSFHHEKKKKKKNIPYSIYDHRRKFFTQYFFSC